MDEKSFCSPFTCFSYLTRELCFWHRPIAQAQPFKFLILKNKENGIRSKVVFSFRMCIVVTLALSTCSSTARRSATGSERSSRHPASYPWPRNRRDFSWHASFDPPSIPFILFYSKLHLAQQRDRKQKWPFN